jgi:hypothetical protein
MTPKHGISILALTLALAAPALAAGPGADDPADLRNVVYPPAANVIDVTKPPYSADNTGKADATAALNAAIKAEAGHLRVIYLPNGTYRVSGTVRQPHRMFTTIIGQSRDGVVIKLDDNSPAFQDRTKESWLMDCTIGGQASFAINLVNFTLDTGTGNPGASGLHFHVNNQGTLRNVVIRSGDGQGVIGMREHGGPMMLEDVTVDGFDTGVHFIKANIITIEGMTLRNQRKLGIHVQRPGVAIRHLLSENAVPVFKGTDNPARKSEAARGLPPLYCVASIIDSRFVGKGGASRLAAIPHADVLFLRNVDVEGYKLAVGTTRGPGKDLKAGHVKEWTSHPPITAFDTEPASLNLPIEEIPDVPWEQDMGKWANVLDFRKDADGDDDGPAFQRAIDSGATTVYFPYAEVEALKKAGKFARRNFRIDSPVKVRGKVRRVISAGGYVSMKDYLIEVVDGEVPVVVFQQIRGGFTASNMRIVQNSARTLALRQMSGLSLHCKRGKVFGTDCVGRQWVLEKGTMYLRQYNCESGNPKFHNRGGAAWIMPLKTENVGHMLTSEPGTTTEIIGTLIFASPGALKVVNNNADVSVAGLAEQIPPTWKGKRFTDPRAAIEETRGDQTRTVKNDHKGFQQRGAGVAYSLYVGRSRARN